jgi:hypothetical protein
MRSAKKRTGVLLLNVGIDLNIGLQVKLFPLPPTFDDDLDVMRSKTLIYFS